MRNACTNEYVRFLQKTPNLLPRRKPNIFRPPHVQLSNTRGPVRGSALARLSYDTGYDDSPFSTAPPLTIRLLDLSSDASAIALGVRVAQIANGHAPHRCTARAHLCGLNLLQRNPRGRERLACTL